MDAKKHEEEINTFHLEEGRKSELRTVYHDTQMSKQSPHHVENSKKSQNQMTEPTTTTEKPESRTKRVATLDVFRGLTIAVHSLPTCKSLFSSIFLEFYMRCPMLVKS